MKRQPSSLRPVLSYPTTTHCFSKYFSTAAGRMGHILPSSDGGEKGIRGTPTGATEEKAEACGGCVCVRSRARWDCTYSVTLFWGLWLNTRGGDPIFWADAGSSLWDRAVG